MMRILMAALLMAGPMVAGEPAGMAGPLYLKTAAKYPAPTLQAVHSREFKCLIAPAGLPADPDEAFAELWARLQAAAGRAGFTVAAGPARKGGKRPKTDASIKTYLDTPGQELWAKGYLLRITAKTKGGTETRSVTVKAIHEDAARTLATPLAAVGVAARTEAEGNVGLGPDGQLAEYVEKGTTWSDGPAQPGATTLSPFGACLPELLQLGLPAATPLKATAVRAVHSKPGHLLLSGRKPIPFALEGWSRLEGGGTFLYEISYRFDEVDYYQRSQDLLEGERFMAEVLLGGLKDLVLPGAGRWGGSKVRLLMNRPLVR